MTDMIAIDCIDLSHSHKCLTTKESQHLQLIKNKFYKMASNYISIRFVSMKPLTIWATIFLIIVSAYAAQKDYTSFVKDLQQKIQQAPFKGSSYERLAYITDTYGTRMWGSTTLQQVIHVMMTMAQQEGFQNVHLQSVKNFTKWVRGKQSLTLISPRPFPTKLDVIGLGGSVKGDIQAQVIVVSDFQQLQKVKDKVPGKIVCFNNKWVDYHTSVQYRVDGPSIAAKYGAKAMLVRSVASQSISSVHTGYMEYDPKYPKIPCAAVTVEDAQMFARMQARGQNITVHLVLQNELVGNSYSNNLIFQIVGSQKPSQVVLAGGHIDTWDTGSQTGANDDGGGFITVFQAFRLLKKLNYRPRRTMRFIAWSGEQSGSQRDGAAQYLQRHLNQMDKHIAAFESDFGSTKLFGFGHQGTGQSIVKDILSKYLSILGAGNFSQQAYSADIDPLYQKGVPMIINKIEDTPDHSFYFKYHHTAGDTMSIMNADDLDSNVVGIASFLFIIADLQTSLRQVNEETLTNTVESQNSEFVAKVKNLKHVLN